MAEREIIQEAKGIKDSILASANFSEVAPLSEKDEANLRSSIDRYFTLRTSIPAAERESLEFQVRESLYKIKNFEYYEKITNSFDEMLSIYERRKRNELQ